MLILQKYIITHEPEIIMALIYEDAATVPCK